MFRRHPVTTAAKVPTCIAPGTKCSNPVVNLKINGQSYQSLYCQWHTCPRMENGHACQAAKPPKSAFCADHLKCTGRLHGMRCPQNVKDDDPSTYKFCSTIHLCIMEKCKKERLRTPTGEDLQYCPDHRCAVENCPGGRTHTPFCTKHTCEEANCASFVDGSGKPGDQKRFCERHRRCKADACVRFCHLWGGGAVAPFCNAHCCEVEGCKEQRQDGGGTCVAHTCVEVACLKGRAGRAEWCKDHKCKSSLCRDRKMGAEYCPRHKCAYEGCDAEGGQNWYCARHQRCSVRECDRRRYFSNDIIYPTCENHHFGVCHGPDGRSMCGRRVENGTAYCDAHLCEVRECREPRMSPSTYCTNHKCISPMCLRPRRTVNWGYLQGIGGYFCDMHACAHPGCQDHAEEDSRFCADHRKCRARGCTRSVDQDGDDPTMCGRHQPRPEARRQEQQQQPQQVPPHPPFFVQGPMMYPSPAWQQPWSFMGGQLG